ncbi:hypothetical protein CD928_03035 [Sphingopyxis sp. GW247-27LB]|nr:hypothetical protein CD928_03035 [Sphingopyxis sp. GW247-27LB]
MQGWAAKARVRGRDKIELDVSTVDAIVEALGDAANLSAQNERLVSTIEIHHRNFDELHERAAAETGTFAAWVAGMTHSDPTKR